MSLASSLRKKSVLVLPVMSIAAMCDTSKMPSCFLLRDVLQFVNHNVAACASRRIPPMLHCVVGARYVAQYLCYSLLELA